MCGEGTAIFAKTKLNIIVKQVNVVLIEKHFAFCLVEQSIHNISYIIITIYRLPDGELDVFFDNLTLLLEELYKVNRKIMICADFNIDFPIKDRVVCYHDQLT